MELNVYNHLWMILFYYCS